MSANTSPLTSPSASGPIARAWRRVGAVASSFGAAAVAFILGGRERAPTPPRDLVSTWLVLLVSCSMGFLASLGLAASNGAESLARSWTSDLESRATVILSTPDDPAQAETALERALDAVRATPGVLAATPLDHADVAALLDPWLSGQGDMLEGLPLPLLIDVALDPGAEAPIALMNQRLREARVTAEVDAHGRWIDRLEPAAARIRTLAYLGLAVIAVSAALMVALACTAALSAQSRMVSVLRLVGARDGYIAALFMRRYQLLAFMGSAVGVGAAALAVLNVSEPVAAVAAVTELPAADAPLERAGEIAPLLPDLAPEPWIWAQFAATPLAFALIATLAAWIASTIALQSAEP